jgi:hypothetical protein
LLGFPGENAEDYRKQIALIPSIVHFPPPDSVGRFWLERFSPYFTNPANYGIRITGPGIAYQYVYNPSRIDLQKIAYDFEYEVARRVDPALVHELTDLAEQWKRRHASEDKPFLYYVKGIGFITVYDGRGEGAPVRKTYEGLAAFLIEDCNEMPKTAETIQQDVSRNPEFAAWAGEPLQQVLGELVDDKILYEEKGRYFTLALPANTSY